MQRPSFLLMMWTRREEPGWTMVQRVMHSSDYNRKCFRASGKKGLSTGIFVSPETAMCWHLSCHK